LISHGPLTGTQDSRRSTIPLADGVPGWVFPARIYHDGHTVLHDDVEGVRHTRRLAAAGDVGLLRPD